MVKTPLSQGIVIGFITITIIGLFVPDAYFILFTGFLTGSLLLGILEMATSEGKNAGIILTMTIVIGAFTVGIAYTELGHAAAATFSPDLEVRGVNVTLIQYNAESGLNGSATIGFVDVGVDDQAAASGAANPQLAFTALAGSIMLALIAAGYWFVKTPTNVPAIIWTIMLVAHQLPILGNDISMSVANGWMGLEFAWLTTFILLGSVALAMMKSLRREDPIIGGMAIG